MFVVLGASGNTGKVVAPRHCFSRRRRHDWPFPRDPGCRRLLAGVTDWDGRRKNKVKRLAEEFIPDLIAPQQDSSSFQTRPKLATSFVFGRISLAEGNQSGQFPSRSFWWRGGDFKGKLAQMWSASRFQALAAPDNRLL